MKATRWMTLGAIATAVCMLAIGTAPAAPAADCNGQINIRYISGPLFGVNGSTYTVEIGLGTGSITGGANNTLSLSTVRFNLDCTFAGLPGCTDDGNVIAYANTITTTCGTGLPSFWTASFPDGNTVDFTAQSPVVIPANQPSFPGFCVLRFDITITNSNDARNDTTAGRVEETVTYSAGTCDNGLPTTGSQSAAIDLCPVCDDSNLCTADTCDTTSGQCVFTPNPPCDDSNACTSDSCNPATGCVYTANPPCDDSNACTTDTCNPATGCVYTPGDTCDDDNACTTDTCDPEEGCVYTQNPPCDDGNSCTDDSCDPESGCVYVPADPLPQECTLPCRITGGGIVYEDTTQSFITDPAILAQIDRATFGGQVGAPYGIVGCHDDDYDQIQGQWTHLRHHRRGSFHASEYNSLVCGCDDGQGGPGVLDGRLCNPGDREPGPEPRPAPANTACWSGKGQYNRNNGRRTIEVAFRVHVEDRGEPGAGQNAGTYSDVYRIEIWIPTGNETADSLADAACCVDGDPEVRDADVIDGGNLIRGNIQIHPPTGNPNNQ